ncbi:MAG: hypothetical protein FWD43_01635 [Coriobacteriia bacterium]|nr:hypothetical protein [Coriobacteriia bacterium]
MRTILLEALGAERDIQLELNGVTTPQKVFMISAVTLFMVIAMLLIAVL